MYFNVFFLTGDFENKRKSPPLRSLSTIALVCSTMALRTTCRFRNVGITPTPCYLHCRFRDGPQGHTGLRCTASSHAMCTTVEPISCLSDAWKVLVLFTSPEAMVHEETLGRFLKKIVRPSICTFKLNADPTDSANEVAQLNCEPAAVEKYKDLIAGWLRMQTLKIKPQKAVKKSTPQKDTSDIPFAPRL